MIPKEDNTVKVYQDHLDDVFIQKKLKIQQCNCFSEDCVNMWQLMSFDEIL